MEVLLHENKENADLFLNKKIAFKDIINQQFS